MVDLNVDNSTGGDFRITRKRSGIEIDGGPPEGGSRDVVSLTALTANHTLETVYHEPGFDYEEFCVNSSQWGYSINGLAYRFGNLAPGSSRTVKFVYRAF
jgi:hypothetical protein